MKTSLLRILLVEDDTVDRMAFLRCVERQSLPYSCTAVGSIAEARAIGRVEKFDVVILDHNLNEGTGFDLLPDFAQTPVIFLTGSESPEVAVRAMKAGASDYLQKDHDRNYLQLVPLAVERALQLQRDREQLIESQELFRQSFSEAPIGKAFIASDGQLLRINPALCQMFGYAEAEFLSGGLPLLTGTPDIQASLENLSRTPRAEICCRHKLGHEIWVQIDTAHVPDSRGRGLTYVSQIQDITGRKNAEAEIRQAKEYAENVIKTAPTLICGLSFDGTVRFINPAATRICGYTEAEIVGQHWWHLFYPGDSMRQGERLMAQVQREQVINQETTLTARDGGKRIISWSSVHNYSIDGSASEILGIGMDITAQRQAEEVRLRLETQLHQSQKMEALGSMAGGIAHEFNNMLGAIIGYTELVKMDLGESHPVVLNLDQVLKASQRAKEIIQQILTFSRRQELKRELLHLRRVVEESLQLLRAALPPAVIIKADISAESPPILGNVTQLHQAMANLCTNAWHAMRNHTGCITIAQKTITLDKNISSNRLSLPDGSYSVLSVTDNGEGMDAATLERVFEPFFTTKGPGKGSGLGMPVVHGIMKSHDGAVSIQSELGQGTTVCLYFPVQSTAVPVKIDVEKPAPPVGHGERILLVDDESHLITIGSRILRHLGYHVTAFTAAKEALAAFAQQPEDFDLVITDLTMPGMTGIGLADALLEVRKDIPILLATGYIEESIREQAGLLGFREILVKPLSTQVLAEAVQRIFSTKA